MTGAASGRRTRRPEDPRVLQVLGSSAGGVARHVAQLVAAQAAAVVAGPAALADRLVPRGSAARFVPVEISDRPGPRDGVVVLRLARLTAGADVVHAHGLRAGAFAVLAARAAGLVTRRRPGVVVTLHNLPVGGRVVRVVAAVLERVVTRGADAVLGVSGDLVDRARHRGARLTERALVPAPPRPAVGDPAAVRHALGDPAALVVTVARLAPQKGLDVLLGAAALLADVDLRWVVAGDGPLATDVAARVARDGLPVDLLGRREDVPDLLAAADVVVSTARWEGQPIAVQEALALGRPVLATAVGGTAEVTGDAAVLVPCEPAAVAAALRGLLADRAERVRRAQASARRAAQLPDVADTVAQLDRVYAQVRRRHPTRPARRAWSPRPGRRGDGPGVG